MNQSINQSFNQSISQSVNQSVSQYVNQSINQSINQSVSQSVSQSINQLLLNQLIKCSISITLAHLTRHKHFTGLLYPWRETLFEIKPISLKILIKATTQHIKMATYSFTSKCVLRTTAQATCVPSKESASVSYYFMTIT